MNEYAVISRFSISPGTSRNLIRPGTMLMLVLCWSPSFTVNGRSTSTVGSCAIGVPSSTGTCGNPS